MTSLITYCENCGSGILREYVERSIEHGMKYSIKTQNEKQTKEWLYVKYEKEGEDHKKTQVLCLDCIIEILKGRNSKAQKDNLCVYKNGQRVR